MMLCLCENEVNQTNMFYEIIWLSEETTLCPEHAEKDT